MSHTVGYSKSSNAKCHTCKEFLPLETLRYGLVTKTNHAETVEWRHWTCVTAPILSQLATLIMDRVPGFTQLSATDQAKIRRAISRRRVDPDLPPVSQSTASATPSQKQRKAEFEAASSSQASSSTGAAPSQKKRKAEFEAASSQPSSSAPRIGPFSVDEEEEEEAPTADEVEELYVSMETQVVGVQYYRGLVGPGEQVRLNREPTNQYDSNAIQVKNIASAQVGHLPKTVVGKLAPLLDQGLVNVEGIMLQGNLVATGKKIFTLNITLKMYGSPNKRRELEPKLIWATPGQRGFQSRGTASNSQPSSTYAAPPMPSYASSSTQRRETPAQAAARLEAARKQQEALQKAAELKKMLHSLEQVDDEERRSSLLDQLLSTDDILNLPVHPNPPGIGNGLVVDLLKHQSQALQWAVERENPTLPKEENDRPVQFWQLRKNGSKIYYFNLATKSPQETPPVLGRGALCADAMGLGKTLTILALILSTKPDMPSDFSNSTLIVAPLSVLSNWSKQISDHCIPGSLTYYVYYGNSRDISPKYLQKYDVVITTYQTVAGEYDDKDSAPSKKKKKIEKTLFAVHWKRIVLDEAHTIRNPKTKMAKAACALVAQRRWALAATPIINSPRDLGSLLTFLQICRPLDKEDFFKRLLLRPLKDGDPAGAELLRNLMNHICIRRTKEMQDADGNHLVPLPPVEMVIVRVTLSDEARAMYDEVEQLSKNRVEAHMRTNNTLAQANVLSLLTRMRQLVLHTGLVPSSYIEELRTGDGVTDSTPQQKIVVTPADKLRLQAKLAQAIEECEECPICFNVLEDTRITSCSHMFCTPCITEVISREAKCPLDRRAITMADLHAPPPPMKATQAPFKDVEEEESNEGSSAKIDQLIALLLLNPTSDKSLVFSQFTSFLDKIAERLDEREIPYVRFDGRMSAKRREETIAQFSIPVADDDQAAAGGRRSRGRSSEVSLGRGEDSDFIMEPADDSDFLDDEDDDSVYATKKKGRAKAKGKGKGKAKASSYTTRTTFLPGENPKIMLISLKAGALGLNLTVANNVYLCNRIGQTKPVTVYQLIADNTVESKVTFVLLVAPTRSSIMAGPRNPGPQEDIDQGGFLWYETQGNTASAEGGKVARSHRALWYEAASRNPGHLDYHQTRPRATNTKYKPTIKATK
ncbi:SNF2 family N-terminal domain-containing protein [Mycena crocata]|nr:SNF2 family N-terminal domain-containing protein [Mycena crocata]